MRIQAHLCFRGQCREAFEFYHELLGGKIVTMLTYGDSPMAAQTPAEMLGQIVHASLVFDDSELLGVDLPASEYRAPQGFYIMHSVTNAVDSERIFNLLASGGKILLPYQETFWSAGFGVLSDRFGIPWEINCTDAPSKLNSEVPA